MPELPDLGEYDPDDGVWGAIKWVGPVALCILVLYLSC